MKPKLIAILYVLLQLHIIAQSDDINHRKYWYYRSRLTNDFMKIGNQQGESLPMSTRAKDDLNYGGINGYTETGADAVSQLGPYICVLATEYKLLTDNGQTADSTLRELYYALEAFNRLDYTAETAFGYTNALDGFFIRQDVPLDFVKNNVYHFNYELNLIPPAYLAANSSQSVNAKGFCSPSHNKNIYYDGNTNNYGDTYANWQYNPTTYNKYSLAMSLDQCINMFNACALINKFLPGNVTYNVNSVPQHFWDNEISIKEEARKISSRMINALQGGGDWRILIPGGNHVDQLFGPGHDAGGNASAYSFAFAEANCKIHSTNNSFNSTEPCLGANNIVSATAGWVAWKFVMSLDGVALDQQHPDNAPKSVGLEAACNCAHSLDVIQVIIDYIQSVVSYIVGWFNHIVYGDPVPEYQNQNVISNVTEEKIEYRSGLFHLEWGSLLRKVLHGGTNLRETVSNYDYVGLLNSAPCKGPSYYSANPNNNTSGWTSRDLIDHAQEQNDIKGEFNGLDYMLYHNLWYIDHPSQYVSPIDNRSASISGYFPFTNSYVTNLGSNANPLNIPRLEYIAADNLVNAPNPTVVNDPANGNVSLRAGKAVLLKPGFSAKHGSTFHAYIQRFHCNSSNDVVRAMQDTTKQSSDYTSTNFDVLPNTNPKQKKTEIEDNTEPVLTKVTDIKKNTISKKTNAGNNKILIYPNPSSGVFTIKFDVNTAKNINITVNDILNNEILHQNVNTDNKEIELDLRSNPKGVYFLNIGFSGGNNVVQKLIIQ